MPLTVSLSLALGRYKQLPQRAGEVWLATPADRQRDDG